MGSIFHTAIRVPRLEDAMVAYGKELGLTFRLPLERRYARLKQQASDGPFTARITYSIEGPVHLELLEVYGEGLFAPTPADGLHHIGAWSKDPLKETEEMAEVGFEWEGSLYAPDGSIPIVFIRRGDLRIELISELRRESFMDWVSGKCDSL